MEGSDNTPHTRLEGKEFSPLIIRRYSTPVLHFVAIITDDDLDSLDSVIIDCWHDEKGLEIRPTTIQEFRNFAGQMSEELYVAYPKTEGIAIIIAADKMVISSLFGDFMNHEQARIELYGLLNFATQI